MKIESTPSAVAHIVSESNSLRMEADVNIYNGKAAEINNGRVSRVNGEVHEPIAEFSSYTGSNHLTWFGEPDTDAQIELMSAINAFCAEVRQKTYSLKAQ